MLVERRHPRSTAPGTAPRDEEPDEFRTCFERDRDRILHSSAFRRLAGKTQVFVFPDDHMRTRLTHALEVAQVATGVARAVGLNVALTEAIALGHDCGHGPGRPRQRRGPRPVRRRRLRPRDVGRGRVARRASTSVVETLDGIRNHSWSRPAPTTPEGEVVSWADRIAYVLSRLRGRRLGGHRRRRTTCPRSCAIAAASDAANSSARSSTP